MLYAVNLMQGHPGILLESQLKPPKKSELGSYRQNQELHLDVRFDKGPE
jgi:hypothetical protein